MASLRAMRRRACGKKRKYASRDLARAAMGNYRGLSQYECRFCGAWHNGHAPRKPRRRHR